MGLMGLKGLNGMMRLPLGDEFDIDKIYRNFDNKMEELESD